MQPSWPTADYLSKVSVVVVQRVTGRGYHDYLSPKLKFMCPYIFISFMAGGRADQEQNSNSKVCGSAVIFVMGLNSWSRDILTKCK